MAPLNPDRIMRMASAFYESCVLFAASEAGVFKFLAANPGSDLPTVAAGIESDERGTRLLLDGCVAVGLLTKTGDTYDNAPESAAFLVPGQPGDLSRAILYNRDVYGAWGKLRELVKSGKPVEPPEIHLGQDPERTRRFVLSMHGRAMGIGQAMVPSLDLDGCQRVLDVGGGPGTFSVLMAKHNPGLCSTVLDLPEVVAIAAELIAEQGMADRVATLGGDYHATPFPGKQDAITFLGVLHQESPENIVNLFTRAREALRPGGRIYVADLMTDATHTSPPFSALFAVNMALTTYNGWVFSDEEVCGWLRDAGFNDPSVKPLAPPLPHWLASATAP